MIWSPVGIVLFWGLAFTLALIAKHYVRVFAGWNLIILTLAASVAQVLALTAIALALH